MKTLKGYKAVSVHGEELWSWSTAASYRVAGCVKYRRNEWVRPYPSFGPLCVFREREDAERFSRSYRPAGAVLDELWCCEYEPSERVALGNRDGRVPLEQCPAGTILAEAIKLVSKVA